MRKRSPSILILVIFLTNFCSAQNDHTVLSYSEYIFNILQYHPVAKQANLKVKLAEAERLAAKGFFDPSIYTDLSQKKFDDKLYYRQFQSKLIIPTRLGIDAVAGYENTDGVFLNPENSTDEFGLWNIGIEVNLLQGLWTNERNTALKQATIFKDMAANQQQIIINDLLFDASNTYLEWQKYTAIQTALFENVGIANSYLTNTINSFLGGEKTAMDTLEASILYQESINLQISGLATLTKVRQQVENYLWMDDSPVELQPSTLPENLDQLYFEVNELSNFENDVNNLPFIQEKLNKINSLEVEQKLKIEKLKPKLKAKYNPLLATTDENISPVYSSSNFKAGLDFSMPILLRKERADIQKGEIKLKELALDIENKRNELSNKIENSIQQWPMLQDQIQMQQLNVEGYKNLLEGENEKFRLGESSVFLLNKRQEKYILGQLKLIELKSKLQFEKLSYLYYTNGIWKN